jgi:spore germination protein YaaH
MWSLLLVALLAADPAEVEIGPHAREAADHVFAPAASWVTAAPQFIPEAARAAAPALSRRVYGYLPYWSSLDLQAFRWDLVSDVVTFSVGIGTDGSISNPHALPGAALLTAAHAHGVKVHVCATLFNTSAGEIATFLGSDTAQSRAIDALVRLVSGAGADGLNFDFEFVAAGNRDAFTTFVRRAHSALRSAVPGAELTLAYPSSTGYTGYDTAALAAATERLLVMEYDWHWRTAPTTGASSPLPSIESAVNGFAAAAPVASLVLGVPYYGYDWPAASNSPGANTTGAGTTVLIKDVFAKFAAYGRLWDGGSQTPWYTQTGTQGWCDDNQSLALKYQYVKSKNLAGIMIWALGYDAGRTEMWTAIADAFGAAPPPPPPVAPGKLQILSATFTPASIAEGATASVTVRVKNVGGQIIGRVAPPPSVVYDESQSSTGSIAGSWRIGVDEDARPSSQPAHPYRWGLQEPLGPGAEATLQAQVRLETAGPRALWAAVIHEGVDVPQDLVGRTQVEVLGGGTSPDAGVADAGSTPDAGSTADAGSSTPDAGTGGVPAAAAHGCTAAGGTWLALLGLAALGLKSRHR